MRGYQKTNKKGKDHEKVINNNNLSILNNKSQTYLSPSTRLYVATDITLCDPLSYIDYNEKSITIFGITTTSYHTRKSITSLWW